MAVRTKITPINRNIELIMQRTLSPEAQSARLASYARGRLAEAQEINRRALGHVPSHETIVDGRRGAVVEGVKPNGVIVYDFDLLDDLFGWIDLQLITHAPVLTGRFRRSFVLFADGVQIDPDAPMPGAREYVYLSTVPYARKIERGLSKQAPDGVFEAVATLAKKRFGNMADIRFSYRSLLLDYVALGGRKGGKKASPAKRSAHNMETDSRTPAIIVKPR